jgi:hypothetical protein
MWRRFCRIQLSGKQKSIDATTDPLCLLKLEHRFAQPTS